MNEIEIRTIPACIVYTAEYDMLDLNGFFDIRTGENILYELQYLMERENPEVSVPGFDADYNFFDYPMEENPDGTYHIRYHDMVDKKGIDNKEGIYYFESFPEIEAAILLHKGSYGTIDSGFASLYEWIERNNYEVSGSGRAAAIHGPWDRENEDEYVNELQVPIRRRK